MKDQSNFDASAFSWNIHWKKSNNPIKWCSSFKTFNESLSGKFSKLTLPHVEARYYTEVLKFNKIWIFYIFFPFIFKKVNSIVLHTYANVPDRK